jgi:formylmethanofuran dehydrogenase subunit C
MMGELAVEKPVKKNFPLLRSQKKFPSTKSCALLEDFSLQEGIEKKATQKTRRNSRVDELERIFLRYDWQNKNYLGFEVLERRLKKVHPFTAKQIEEFASTRLPKHQDKRGFFLHAGDFISIIINNSNGRRFTLHLEGVSERIRGLGSKNEKSITIYGDVGYSVGFRMKKGGKIVVHGDADESAGNEMRGGELTIMGNSGKEACVRMKGGKVTILGNAGDGCCRWMGGGELEVRGNVGDNLGDTCKKGKIVVHGNAGKEVGDFMCGGEIHIEGDIESVGTLQSKVAEPKVKIFNKGKQVEMVLRVAEILMDGSYNYLFRKKEEKI